jgi:hypothetical protein
MAQARDSYHFDPKTGDLLTVPGPLYGRTAEQRRADHDRAIGATRAAELAGHAERVRWFRANTAARILATLGENNPVMAVGRADALIKELGL